MPATINCTNISHFGYCCVSLKINCMGNEQCKRTSMCLIKVMTVYGMSLYGVILSWRQIPLLSFLPTARCKDHKVSKEIIISVIFRR